MQLVNKIVIAFLILFAAACNKFLDVQPEDRFLDKQVYSNRGSIQNALNGIYLNLGKASMYGENLTTTTLDVLAQLYPSPNTQDVFYSLARLNYNDARSQQKLEQIWDTTYATILNINIFLHNVNTVSAEILTQTERDLMMGEAYGLRAYLSFDMLRLFGPVYKLQPQAISVPYPTTPGTEIPRLLPASGVMDSVLHDLQRAEDLLAGDPVIHEGVKSFTNDNADNFFRYRNRRMNYYAVLSLKARVKLYGGDKPGALEAANTVISRASKWFPWSPPGLSTPGITNPDRIFSSEVLFAAENQRMETMQRTWFNAANTTNRLMPLAARLNSIYNNFLNDYRFRSWWEVDRFANTTDKSFFKYADVADKTLPFRRLQPLIRMSEMYYIAAECDPDRTRAETLFNTVLYNRGIANVTLAPDREPQLRSEYEKEFWGEGQLFFFYKRVNAPTIPSGITANANVIMTQAQYVLPLPLSETEFR